jgi:hypothetical protein
VRVAAIVERAAMTEASLPAESASSSLMPAESLPERGSLSKSFQRIILLKIFGYVVEDTFKAIAERYHTSE